MASGGALTAAEAWRIKRPRDGRLNFAGSSSEGQNWAYIIILGGLEAPEFHSLVPKKCTSVLAREDTTC